MMVGVVKIGCNTLFWVKVKTKALHGHCIYLLKALTSAKTDNTTIFLEKVIVNSKYKKVDQKLKGVGR